MLQGKPCVVVLAFVGTTPTGVISRREGVVVELSHIFHPKISSSLTKRSSGNAASSVSLLLALEVLSWR
jgi:hypothetical protein